MLLKTLWILFCLITTTHITKGTEVEEAMLEKASDSGQIPKERKRILDEAAITIRESGVKDTVFICTHNSRRSHFAQVAMALMSERFGLGINTFSGGTEATALNNNAFEAMRREGVDILLTEEKIGDGNKNYVHILTIGGKRQRLFSKRYDDAANPRENFAAVMVCDDADRNCPFVEGASARISLPYTDPKHSDGSGKEATVYGESFVQILREMHYLATRLKTEG